MAAFYKGENSCLEGIPLPLPLPPNEFHEGSCGFRVVFEQIRHVFGLFLAAVGFRVPGGGGVTFSGWCFGFVLGLFSWFGGYPGVSERAFYPLFVRGNGQVCGCWDFGGCFGRIPFSTQKSGYWFFGGAFQVNILLGTISARTSDAHP